MKTDGEITEERFIASLRGLQRTFYFIIKQKIQKLAREDALSQYFNINEFQLVGTNWLKEKEKEIQTLRDHLQLMVDKLHDDNDGEVFFHDGKKPVCVADSDYLVKWMWRAVELIKKP